MVKQYSWVLLLVIFWAGTVSAEVQSVKYRTFKKGEIVNSFHFDLHQKDGVLEKVFVTVVEGSGSSTNILQDTIYIGPDGATTNWHATGLKNSGQHTKYDGQRIENKIVLTGKWKGEEIKKELEIDEAPFFYNPKVSLTPFVLSDAEEIEFWGLRQDKLTVFKMIAKKKGEEVVKVNGKPIRAMRVYWTVEGLGSMFFKRTYWFRPGDGLFVKQLTSDGGIREFISEGTWENTGSSIVK